MKNLILILAFFGFCNSASAQWAVLDQSVLDVVKEIRDTVTGKKDLSKFVDQAALDSAFETISLTEPEKYIGTVEDCGDVKINANHYNACLGLRRLRIKTLEQTADILAKIKLRKEAIKDVVSQGDGARKAGELQRAQFMLQAIQTEMQNDAMELESLRYGYKQRETIYEMQMAEARRNSDTRPASATGGFSVKVPVPFVPR